MQSSLMLLPGLDGTGELFAPFMAAAPAGLDLRVARLPSDRPRGYLELGDWLREAIGAEPVTLIAESFSGPLAVLAANSCPNVQAIVLVATFVESPFPRLFGRIPKALLGGTPPAGLFALFLTGGDRELAEWSRRATLQSDPAVVGERISAVLSVDVSLELAALSQPILYVQATADRLIHRRCLRRILAIRPTVQVARVKGPHLILQTRPELAWRELTPFLERSGATHRGPTAPRLGQVKGDQSL